MNGFRNLKALVSILTIVGVYYVFMQNGKHALYKYRSFTKNLRIPNISKITSDRWIVVTTISQPTDDIKYLSTLKGWKVVVVGDTKTPSNWKYDNCVYLSLADQKRLGFSIAEMLPEKSYTRKNIGYLYAIANGAKVIYETDDDNRPLDKLRQFTYSDETTGLMFADKRKTYNPYRYFGQSSIWPRGYPLSSIGENFTYSYLLGKWKSPLIQQGLVNGDPDVDAIYRLGHKLTDVPLNISFIKRNPPVFVPSFVFTPFNSQNTFYLYNAFWALFLPSTTKFRVCDIWRSYWAQRLLWEIGGHIGFYPPNAFSKRNPHSYLSDFYEEKQMYFHTEDLIELLSNWNCNVTLSFFDCVLDLTNKMADSHFIKSRDVDLVSNWISDLKSINYSEPIRTCSCRGNSSKLNVEGLHRHKDSAIRQSKVYFSAVEQSPSLITPRGGFKSSGFKSLQRLIDQCPDVNLTGNDIFRLLEPPKHENILLLIIFNHPFYDNIKTLELLYREHFPYVVYCGENITAFEISNKHLQEQVTFIEVDIHIGHFAQRCLTQVIRMNYFVDGYLLIMDDLILNISHIKAHSLDKIWVPPPEILQENMSSDRIWYWYKHRFGLKAYSNSMRDLKQKGIKEFKKFKNILKSNTGYEDGFYHVVSDVIYLPAKYANQFLYFMDIFSRNEVFLEIAFPTVLGGIERKENWNFLTGTYLWTTQRSKFVDFLNKIKDFLHPVKFGTLMNSTDGRRFLCKNLLKPLIFEG